MHAERERQPKGVLGVIYVPVPLPSPAWPYASSDDLSLSSTNPLTTGRKSAMFVYSTGLLVLRKASFPFAQCRRPDSCLCSSPCLSIINSCPGFARLLTSSGPPHPGIATCGSTLSLWGAPSAPFYQIPCLLQQHLLLTSLPLQEIKGSMCCATCHCKEPPPVCGAQWVHG